MLAGFYADRLDSELGGQSLSPAAQEQVAEARDRALSPVDPGALPPRGSRVVTEAVQDAGVATFHLAALIGAACSRSPGCSAALLLRNPRRPTAAERCPGGQLVGAPEEAGAQPAAAVA